MGSMLPEDVRSFLRSEIDEYDQLELLLLLHRAGKELGLPQVLEQSRIGEPRTRAALEHLARRGLVRTTPAGPLFAPHRPEWTSVVDRLARAYDEAMGIDTPRIWTAERDKQVWAALQD